MFSFFKKKTNKITYTQDGSHGRHWYGLLGRAISDLEIEKIYSELFSNPTDAHLNDKDKALVITNDMVRGFIKDHTVITIYPYLRSLVQLPLEISFISEWSHSDGLEAIVHAGHSCGAGINFFATDYVINKEIYKENKQIDVKIMGFTYMVKEPDTGQFKLPGINGQEYTVGENFCGYIPGDLSDEINFIGKIFKIQKRCLNYINGFIITVGITLDFNIDIFVAEACLDFELVENKSISGYAWITGTLEK